MNIILTDMKEMFESLIEDEVNEFIIEFNNHIQNHGKNFNIIGLGAGRMGYALRSFIMRLTHMDFNATMIGDTSVPRVNESSLIIVNSSSGETPSILQYTQQASNEGGKIFLTCCDKNSSIAKYSHHLIQVPIIDSIQLMKSPYEQFTMLLYDYIVIKLMEHLSLDDKKVSNNHSILE